MTDFEFKTKPRAHQLAEFDHSRALDGRGLFWEMGCGKSKPTIDTAAALREAGEIDAMVVMAPRTVHANWGYEEIPKHFPDRLDPRPWVWDTQKSTQVAWKGEYAKWRDDRSGFPIFCTHYNSIMTRRCADEVLEFMKTRRCLYVADESAMFKTPSTKRTIRILASSKYAPYRRVLDGTPVADSPFDIYAQAKFLWPNYWKREAGLNDFGDFKTYFGVWQIIKRGSGKSKREWPELVEYRNLAELNRLTAQLGLRLLLEDVEDMPEKQYSTIPFDLAPAQRRAYDELRREFMTWLDSGEMVSSELAIVRMTRLQQIVAGFVPGDNDDELVRIVPADKNPRLSALGDILEATPGQAIVWSKYTQSVDDISELCRKSKLSYVVFDGRTSDDARERAKRDFQEGRVKVFIAKPSAAGTGLTLTAATVAIYYDNGWSLRQRLQSEGRNYRIGQDKAVTYYDLAGRNSIDGYIIHKLRQKRDVASQVTGDEVRTWI